MVVYDPTSKQLVVHRAQLEDKLDLTECPYCHRPLRDEARDSNHANSATNPGTATSYASPEYFRMLHHSLPGSTDSSGPPSPRRRLTHPVQSGRSTPAYPPRDAEFVGSSPAPPSPHGISSSAFSPNYFQRFFVEERELGRGGKGVVLLVKHVLDNVSLGHFALKRIPVGDDHEWLEKVLVEVQLLQHLSHQNLVSYRHVWLEDVKLSNFGPSVPCAFVLQQFCNSGDLHNYIFSTAQASTTTEQIKQRIRRRSKNQPELPQNLHGPRKLQFEEIYSFFKDITSGLNHLHVNGYIHRDLKPSNCLLHNTGKELRVLVSDFGEVQTTNMVRRSTGATGTISYCAPEVLRRELPSGNFGNFTTKSDVFSLGMILYFLCFAELPYNFADHLHEENEDLDQLRDEIVAWVGLEDKKRIRPDLPDKLYTFLQRLLSLNPINRPSADEILHSIKTGSGLDENPEPRPRSSGQIFDDLRTSSRISSADSPAPGISRHRTSREKLATGFERPEAPTKLRLNSFREDPPMRDDTDAPATSPGGSLVLRSKHSSPIKVEPPAQLSSTSRRLHRFYGNHPVYTLRIIFLILKIISINLPCMPVAARPPVAFPLLGLAILDLLLLDFSIYVSLSLVGLHVIAIVGAMRLGMLCVPKASIWEGV